MILPPTMPQSLQTLETIKALQNQQQAQQRQQASSGGAGPIGALAGGTGLYKAGQSLFGGGEAAGAAPAAVGDFSFANPSGAAGAYASQATSGAALDATTAPAVGLANYLGPLGIIAGGYGLGQNFGQRKPLPMGLSGAALGGGAALSAPLIGATFPVGLPAALAIGALAGGGLGMIKSGKHEDQVRRDQVRGSLQSTGLLDSDYNIETAKGNRFNVGVDGGPRPEYGSDSSGRPIYRFNVQKDRPFSSQTVAWVNPLAEIITRGDDKLRSDFAGYFTNAALSDADNLEGIRANVLHFIEKAGLNKDSMYKGLQALKDSKGITDQEYNVYAHNLDILFGGLANQYNTDTVAQTEAKLAQAASLKPQTQIASPSGAPVVPMNPAVGNPRAAMALNPRPQMPSTQPIQAVPRPISQISSLARPAVPAQRLGVGSARERNDLPVGANPFKALAGEDRYYFPRGKK